MINLGNLNRMKAGIDNIGCTEEERSAWAHLTAPLISAATNQSLAAHPMPPDAEERMARAESMFLAIQGQNRRRNRARYL